MAYKADVLEVLIASPSDVQKERDLITKAIHDWNIENSHAEQVVLLPVRWETHANTEYDGYDTQEVLNRQFVRGCDILVGAMRSKLGTPTRKAESGSVEEIEEFIKSKKPVKLYFSTEGHPENVDLEQLNKLRKFKNDYQGKGIYKNYENSTDLKDKIRADLTAEVRKFKKKQLGPENHKGGLKGAFFIFHASTDRPLTGKIWHELVTGSYQDRYLTSELCQASIEKLLKFKQKGQLAEVQVLGLYYGNKYTEQNGVRIKITDIKRIGNQLDFSFEYIEDTGLPSRLIVENIGKNYSKHDGQKPQLIVNVGMELNDVVVKCRARLADFNMHVLRENALRRR